MDREEKEILPGVKADLIASTRGKVLAVETKGSGGSIKEAAGQGVTYLVSDLISESYVLAYDASTPSMTLSFNVLSLYLEA